LADELRRAQDWPQLHLRAGGSGAGGGSGSGEARDEQLETKSVCLGGFLEDKLGALDGGSGAQLGRLDLCEICANLYNWKSCRIISFCSFSAAKSGLLAACKWARLVALLAEQQATSTRACLWRAKTSKDEQRRAEMS